jgi:hypothetical protein
VVVDVTVETVVDRPRDQVSRYAGADCARTRMTLRNRGEPAGFSRLVAPVLEQAVRRATRQELERLRKILVQL